MENTEEIIRDRMLGCFNCKSVTLSKESHKDERNASYMLNTCKLETRPQPIKASSRGRQPGRLSENLTPTPNLELRLGIRAWTHDRPRENRTTGKQALPTALPMTHRQEVVVSAHQWGTRLEHIGLGSVLLAIECLFLPFLYELGSFLSRRLTTNECPL